MAERERRFYLCTGVVCGYSKLHTHPQAHILGEVVNLTEDGKRVTALAVWAAPKPTTEVPPITPDVFTWVMEARFRCRHAEVEGERCGRHSRWEIGTAAFSALMERYGYGKDDTDLPQVRRAVEVSQVGQGEPP